MYIIYHLLTINKNCHKQGTHLLRIFTLTINYIYRFWYNYLDGEDDEDDEFNPENLEGEEDEEASV